MTNKIFNIPASCSFTDVLAEKFLTEYQDNPLELADVLFLLPNRRAVKALADAFVRLKGLSPTMLPRMMPIGDVEEDEMLISGFDNSEVLKTLSPAMERNERLLLFTKIILSKPSEFGLEKLSANQACSLAQELATLIDTVNNENLSFDNLKNLVPEEYSAYWQETLKFLEIITRFWPEILKERNLVDPSFRRNQLLSAQADLWKKNPPKKRIVAAGTTATFPAMKKLVKTILELENGELILAGLDKNLDVESWAEIDETNPQYELKDLLDYLEFDRKDVEDYVEPNNLNREVFISEIMRPAKTTDKWRDIKNKHLSREAFDGLQVISCPDIRQEALSIALIMRENLEIPEHTTALVTTDRNLARRVAAELERWEIKVDDSAGRPLATTAIGAYLRLMVKACESDFAPVDFLSLLKHPFTAAKMTYAEIRKLVREYEKKVLRSGKEDEELDGFVVSVKEFLRDFYEIMKQPSADFKELIRLHVLSAEALASTSDKEGVQILWRGEAGEAGARFIASVYEKADILGTIEPKEYAGLLEALMSSVTVRPKYGTHPRLNILGPIEARLTHFDTVIIGEVNEGAWPKPAGADPWMSRPMKKDFGFPMPEKIIGVLANDFGQLMANSQVYLTRADRVQGTPMVKSRWWMRLETVLKAMGVNIDDIENNLYSSWAKFLDRSETFVRLCPPEPRPPVSARPRELSASAIENWMRDPYIIFAKYILKLKPLDELEQDLSMKDYGNIIHAVLEAFNKKFPLSYPQNAKEELLKLGREYFAENEVAQETRAFWWPNFEKTVDWLTETEAPYRRDIAKVNSEVQGSFSFDAPAGKFTITAKADRVDETRDGRINVIDYKTGQARSPKEVAGGYAPQLPIEGLIAKFGGFENIPAKEVEKLVYWQLGRKEVVIDDNMEQLLDNSYQRLKDLVSVFDFETTPYISKPNPKYAPKYSDYEHLSRIKEWSVQESGDE